jgi:pimeloyl-ACP methyl ester carboxylesterase
MVSPSWRIPGATRWRHWRQAGFRVAAPDMRGYGGTTAPADIEQYTLLHLVGDMVDLVRVLGQSQAVIVGHDWGAAVAWNSALLRPDLFRAVVGMSVPYAPPGKVDLISSLESAGIHDFYMQYFQPEGVAEAELERDPAASIRRIHFSGSGDGAAAQRGRPPGHAAATWTTPSSRRCCRTG